MKKDIRAYGYEELRTEIQELGEKPFRAGQIYDWQEAGGRGQDAL